jgi:hypothetical protein
MKNAFVVTSLFVIVSYPIAIVAEMIGIVPFSVRSLPEFVGVYASAGILAFAFGDYFGRRGQRSRSAISDQPSAVSDQLSAVGAPNLSQAIGGKL